MYPGLNCVVLIFKVNIMHNFLSTHCQHRDKAVLVTWPWEGTPSNALHRGALPEKGVPFSGFVYMAVVDPDLQIREGRPSRPLDPPLYGRAGITAG